MPLVSIILPAYNAEPTISRAIEAVIAQDFRDWELIISDDGSTDGTLDHILSFLGKDERIFPHTHSHSGVSYTRNRGLSLARGELIAFLDADDVPHEDWLSSLVALIGDADMAACGYDVIGSDDTRSYGTEPVVPAGVQVVSANQFTCDLFSNRLMYQGYVWNKLFRRSLIEEGKPVRFTRGIAYNEDRLFVYEYLKRCASVAVEGTARYGYRQGEPRMGYDSSHATEISAFDIMADDLEARAANGEPLDDAMHHLRKDLFRACVELFWAADREKDPDAVWLIERVRDLSGYRDEFADYPAEFQKKLRSVLA